MTPSEADARFNCQRFTLEVGSPPTNSTGRSSAGFVMLEFEPGGYFYAAIPERGQTVVTIRSSARSKTD